MAHHRNPASGMLRKMPAQYPQVMAAHAYGVMGDAW
jgi:hypothetical protein